MKKVVLLLFAALLCSVPAWAQSANPWHWTQPAGYVAVNLGAFGPADGKFAEYEVNPGIAGNLIFGRRLSENFRVQGELGYMETGSSLIPISLDAMPLTVTGLVGIPLGDFEPYMLAGAGAYFYKAMNQNKDTDGVASGGYLGAGLAYHWKAWSFSAEVRYLMTTIVDAPNDGMLMFGGVALSY